MIDAIRTRRSTRKFRNDMPADELLEKIVEAGRYAASGCNVQNAHFIVVKNRKVLEKLKDLVMQEFAAMETDESTFGSIKHSVEVSKKGGYVFHYDPPVLIIVANCIDNPNAIADTACAVNNMMLMANCLDLGSCWINQLRWLNENSVMIDYLKTLGMKENERVYASLALGYPDTADGMPERNPLPRTGNEVTVIE